MGGWGSFQQPLEAWTASALPTRSIIHVFVGRRRVEILARRVVIVCIQRGPVHSKLRVPNP